MKILVTAGSTRTMIDQVRCISNVFKGRTGFEIYKYLVSKGHEVKLVTSNVDMIPDHYWADYLKYQTYDELYDIMKNEITTGEYDVVIHSAAVSDYKPVGTYVESFGPCENCFLPRDNCVCEEHGGKEGDTSGGLVELDSSGKVGSDHNVLYLKMVPTEKIVDRIRDSWGFKGCLIKFKLQVDMSDEELIDVATKSMKHSHADIMVANCLEWSREKAYMIIDGLEPSCIERNSLPQNLEIAINNEKTRRFKS